jgi:DNA uptake protein ComE-like DNA-binding protein
VIAQAAPRKLNVNKLTLEQLRRHPYINYYQAKAITDYRRLYGPIKSLKDLRLSTDFTDADIRRLEPYVEY